MKAALVVYVELFATLQHTVSEPNKRFLRAHRDDLFRHKKEILSALAEEAAEIVCALVVLCAWEAYDELARVLQSRSFERYHLELPNWPKFLLHCVRQRHYHVLRAHAPYVDMLQSWQVVWPVQLSAACANPTHELHCFQVLVTETNENATLFDFLSSSVDDERIGELLKTTTTLSGEWSDPRTGQTLLHAACSRGCPHLLKCIITQLSEVHFQWRAHSGLTPFHTAATRARSSVVHFLLQKHRSREYDVAPTWSPGVVALPLQSAVAAGVDKATLMELVTFYSKSSIATVLDNLTPALRPVLQAVLPQNKLKRRPNEHVRAVKRKRLS
jgi:hypothetical protein